MGEDNVTLNATQKDKIYKDMLVPLKAKISQILLYDTKAALQFLQIYNEIIENQEQTMSELIKSIVELEFSINEYEKSEGKEKVFEEKNKAFLQRINDMKINSIQISLEDFENEFAQLKMSYEEDIPNYSFKDRAVVEKELHELQASLIMRQVAQGRTREELQQTITEQDKVGLNIFVNDQINILRQSADLNDIATKINNIVITDKDAVLNPELWRWINAAEREEKSEKNLQITQTTGSTGMIIAPKKNNNGLVDWISRLFSKEPIFPLQISDLKKIDMQWLSKYIPKSMLVELENQRLCKEGRKVDDRYVPDSKAMIYSMFKERENDRKEIEIKQYEFLKENGAKLEVVIDEWRVFEGSSKPDGTTVEMKIGDNVKRNHACISTHTLGNINPRLNDTLTYANLLDKIFNTNFQQQLLQEIQDIYIDNIKERYPIYKSLRVSFDNLYEEYKSTVLDFEAIESAKRKQFYKKNRFKEQIKIKEQIKKQDIENSGKKKKEKEKEKKKEKKKVAKMEKHNKVEIEQGG